MMLRSRLHVLRVLRPQLLLQTTCSYQSLTARGPTSIPCAVDYSSNYSLQITRGFAADGKEPSERVPSKEQPESGRDAQEAAAPKDGVDETETEDMADAWDNPQLQELTAQLEQALHTDTELRQLDQELEQLEQAGDDTAVQENAEDTTAQEGEPLDGEAGDEEEDDEDPDDMPSLAHLMSLDDEEAQKERRRFAELAKQVEIQQSRVRKVDIQGRSYATGKRKSAVARVWLWPGEGQVVVNDRPFDDYFPVLQSRADVVSPFAVLGMHGCFDVRATVRGGGTTGQAQAVRHGISRALQLQDPSFRPYLKKVGLMTRDPRVVERKKPGRKKARKAFQWVKR